VVEITAKDSSGIRVSNLTDMVPAPNKATASSNSSHTTLLTLQLNSSNVHGIKMYERFSSPFVYGDNVLEFIFPFYM